MRIADASQRDAAGTTGRTGRGGGNKAGVMSMLSIFLLLLAFFLMLNTLASFETTRTRAVLGSLHATFNIGNPSGREHEFGSFVGKVGAADRLHRETTLLLRTLFGIDRYDIVRFGNVIVVDIDAAALFTGDARPAPALLVLTSGIARAALPPPPGVEINLEVTARRAVGPLADADEAALDIATRRAGALVRGFSRTGFEPYQLLAGLEPGNPRKLRVEFRVTDEAFAPLKVSR